MTIEGLGKKFQEARLARKLTLDEAARMTKIRPQRLAEIEADDFSQFPSLAYAKGFLLIYGKFLDVDVTPYLDAFEDSESVTVDGYSYLQENERAKPVSAPVVRRRPAATGGTGGSNRVSPMPLIVGVVVLVVGFLGMKFFLNVQRLAPARGSSSAQTSATATPAVASGGSSPTAAPNIGGCRYECAGRVRLSRHRGRRKRARPWLLIPQRQLSRKCVRRSRSLKKNCRKPAQQPIRLHRNQPNKIESPSSRSNELT